MLLSELITMELSDRELDRILFEGTEYGGESGDVIMVLGSRKACDYRVPMAARLFREGKAPRVLLCGGRVQETSEGVLAEHEAMLRAALRLGVPREAILTEERSMDTAENLTLGREKLRRELPGRRRVILVTAPYHMKRALLMGRRLMEDYELIPCPAELGSTRRENWMNNERARRRVLDEWGKFGYYIRTGAIEDMEL